MKVNDVKFIKFLKIKTIRGKKSLYVHKQTNKNKYAWRGVLLLGSMSYVQESFIVRSSSGRLVRVSVLQRQTSGPGLAGTEEGRDGDVEDERMDGWMEGLGGEQIVVKMKR